MDFHSSASSIYLLALAIFLHFTFSSSTFAITPMDASKAQVLVILYLLALAISCSSITQRSVEGRPHPRLEWCGKKHAVCRDREKVTGFKYKPERRQCRAAVDCPGNLYETRKKCKLDCVGMAESSNRSRRSYDVRRRGKDAAPENAVKGAAAGVFATENSTVVVAQIGGTATLPCVVRKFNTGVVSWIRKDNHRLLTVGLTTYSADGRFLVEHVRHLQNWGLLIKHVQPEDAGVYECQVSTHPPTSIFVVLKVTEAVAEILGAPDLHIRAGSTLRLVCSLKHSTEPPSYVFWYHGQRMINYDAGVMFLADRSSSVLLLHETNKSDNGNYTCSPSNAVPASINVHVLNATAEEKPAAMQHANTSTSSSTYVLLNFGAMSVSVLVLQCAWR